MSDNLAIGLVIRLQSGFYNIQTANALITCTLRGRLKQEKKLEDIIALGDKVRVDGFQDGTGVIEEICERKNVFVRLAPTARGTYKQILLANVDQIFFIFACTQPSPSLRMLDRFLVIAEKQRIPPVVVVNKIDLMDIHEVKQQFSIYEALKYPVLYTSAKQGTGTTEMRKMIRGKISAFAGPSGVGKSSLLNNLQPDLGLKIKAVKQVTQKGRHATVAREMFPLDEGGYVADLPGLRQLQLWDIEPEELDGYFPEIRPLVTQCKFNDCSHSEEPNCAVKDAVENGQIHPNRYDSYLRMRAGIFD